MYKPTCSAGRSLAKTTGVTPSKKLLSSTVSMAVDMDKRRVGIQRQLVRKGNVDFEWRVRK